MQEFQSHLLLPFVATSQTTVVAAEREDLLGLPKATYTARTMKPNEVKARLLRGCVDYLAEPLTRLFRTR